MLLKEIMTKDVELLDNDATLNEAARIMKDRNIGSIPVRCIPFSRMRSNKLVAP